MRRECECNCHPINHCLQLSLTPLDCAKSHNNMENEYYWQNICKCSNCISYEPQTVGIDQSKMFDFNAIQVIEDEELQQLPEAVNREIVKNSQEIIFEEEEKVSERNLIKLNDIKSKLLNHNQKIISEEREEDVLMQRAMEKDMINKESKKNNQKIEKIFEKEKEDALMQTTLIKMNKDKDKILKHSQKIVFKEDKRDFSEKYIIRLKEEKADILKNSQEIMYEETKDDFLKRNMILLNEKNADNLKNYQEVIFKQEEGALERKLVKLDEGNSDILKNHCIYDEKEQFAFMKIEKNPEDIKHLVRHTVYKPKQKYRTRSNEFARKDYEACLEKSQRLHNRKCQLIMLVSQDQKNIEKNTEKNVFMEKEQNSQKKFYRSLSDEFLTINDKRFFKESIRNKNNQLIVPINQDKKNPKSDPFSIEEHNSSKKYHRNYTDYFVTVDDRRSKEIAISNMKNIRILERHQKSMQQIPKFPFYTNSHSVISLDHLNSNSIFGQQLDYDFLKGKNGSQVKQHDNIRIENEKTLRKSLSCHLTKIAIQDKLYSNDNCSLVSSIYDLSSESDFCEGDSESNCREQLMRNTLKDVETINSVESNLSRENIISNINNPKEYTKNHIVEAIASINNNIRDDKLTASSHFNRSFNKSIDDGSNLVKYAAASNIKERITCVDYEEQNIHEAKKKYRYPNTSSRKLVSNLDESEEPFSIAEKQLSCRKTCIQNNDEELTTQKSRFLNASCKHLVRDIESSEWFDDAITVEKQIDHNITKTNEKKTGDFSNSNILCENIVNDVVLDNLK